MKNMADVYEDKDAKQPKPTSRQLRRWFTYFVIYEIMCLIALIIINM